MRKLAEARAELVEREAEYQLYRARLDEWLAEVRATLSNPVRHFEDMLVRYLEEVRTQTARINPEKAIKSIKLPSGTIRSTGPGAGTIEVLEPDLFIEWARENDRSKWLNIKVIPAVSAIKADTLHDDDGRVIDPETGQEVPGLLHRPGTINYKAVPEPLSQPGRTLGPPTQEDTQ